MLHSVKNSPPKVLHVAKKLSIGGTEKVLQLLVEHINKEIFSPYVFAHEDGARGNLLRAKGIPTYIGSHPLTVLENTRPDIIHIHRAGWAEPSFTRAFALYKRNNPDTLIFETNVFGRHDDSPFYDSVDTTLFISNFCASIYAQQTNTVAASPRYEVLYNPVDTDFFSAASPSPHERDYSVPHIGRLSRPDAGKWSPLALTFLPELTRLHSGLLYRIIGMIPEAREFCSQHGLRQYVEEVPPIYTDKDIATFFASVSVLAHANDTGESFGLAIAEAMACGLPVVTHPAEGLRDNAQLELVEHGITGLIAANAQEYTSALHYLLTHPAEAQRMGKAAQEKAQALFDVKKIVRQLEEMYTIRLAHRNKNVFKKTIS